jgi:predicted outer membrane protein
MKNLTFACLIAIVLLGLNSCASNKDETTTTTTTTTQSHQQGTGLPSQSARPHGM